MLNFELKPSYTLVVRVTDNGTPVLSGTANITVNLTDVAEAGPKITGVYLNSTAWLPAYSDFVDDGVINSSRLGYKVSGASQLSNSAWVSLNQIVLTFSADVSASLDLNDFDLSGVAGLRADGTTGVIPRIVSFTAVGNVVRLTLNQSLDAAQLQIKAISAGIFDNAGNRLDGEWTTSQTGASGMVFRAET